MALEADQEFVNAYIERQQRAIADLTNKIVLLETQLVVASKKIAEFTAEASKAKGDEFSNSEIKKTEE